MSEPDACTLVEELLAAGAGDWVSMADVYGIAAYSTLEEPAELRALALGLIAEVLFGGLMVAGQLEPRFVQWECSTAAAFERVAEEWLARKDPDLTPGEIAWFTNTPLGQEIGEAVLARGLPPRDGD